MDKKFLGKTYHLFIVLASFLLVFSIPNISSDNFVDITDQASMENFLIFEPISGFSLDSSDISKLDINVNGSFIDYSFKLDQKDNDFSLNYVFLPPGTDVKKASELLELIPGADGVSTYDFEKEKTVGYLPIHGGLGEDFDIFPLVVYEVSVKRDTNLNFSIFQNG